jgi:hypothetical protein
MRSLLAIKKKMKFSIHNLFDFKECKYFEKILKLFFDFTTKTIKVLILFKIFQIRKFLNEI